MSSQRNGSTHHHQRAGVLRFGEIARKLGFIDEKALQEALTSQRMRVETGQAHKLLGLILLELGHIDNQQLIDILRQFEQEEKQHRIVAV
ncbi:MAG TPA: hypothetical protein VHF22_15605 [Planctomycetota bacterium]|nr:hypothetical protein [Planctomycetota bacterium]